jgi:hypothetical protein
MAAEISTLRPSILAAMSRDNDRDQIFSGGKKIQTHCTQEYHISLLKCQQVNWWKEVQDKFSVIMKPENHHHHKPLLLDNTPQFTSVYPRDLSSGM